MRKPGFVRFRARRKRKTYGDLISGESMQIVAVVKTVVLELPDFRERVQVAQRRLGLTDEETARRMGIYKATFCLYFRRKRITETVLAELERVLGVTREYWTAPIEVPKRVPPGARLDALVAAVSEE